MNYRKKKVYADKTQHIVYYLHTMDSVPCSAGWTMEELRPFAEEGRNLSIYIKIQQ